MQRALRQTTDLSRRIGVHGNDELTRLAATLNAMLDSLERSAAAQKNLVADASHELRTPLSSIRTHIELLVRADAIPAGERERMVRSSSARSRS
jgi:two-component system, OmpR family, sensor histidine kinase MprB